MAHRLFWRARRLGWAIPTRREHTSAKRWRLEGEAWAFWSLICAMPACALLLASQGEAARAVELYTLASQSPYVANSRWFEDVFGKHIAAAAERLPPEVVAAARERGRARDL